VLRRSARMSILNPYDDFCPSEGSFWDKVYEFFSDLGFFAWLFLLSPLGLTVGVVSLFFSGSTFLFVCVLIGGSMFVVAILLGVSSFIWRFVAERKREEPSKGISLMFGIAGILGAISSICGLVAITWCLTQFMTLVSALTST
jgi:hypothetical protein